MYCFPPKGAFNGERLVGNGVDLPKRGSPEHKALLVGETGCTSIRMSSGSAQPWSIRSGHEHIVILVNRYRGGLLRRERSALSISSGLLTRLTPELSKVRPRTGLVERVPILGTVRCQDRPQGVGNNTGTTIVRNTHCRQPHRSWDVKFHRRPCGCHCYAPYLAVHPFSSRARTSRNWIPL